MEMAEQRDDLRTRIAKAIAGPRVAEAFGKLDSIGPGTRSAVEDAHRQADAVLAVLPEQYGAAGPGQAVRGETHRDEPRDHMKVYREFWADLVEIGGMLNLDRVARELADFSHLMSQVPLVYDHVTSGLMTKPNYYAADVVAASNDRVERIVEENLADFEREEVAPLRREIARMQQVIRDYAGHVESGEKFDALVSLVPGLVSDDGAYGAVS